MTAVCLQSEKSDKKYTHCYPAPHFFSENLVLFLYHDVDDNKIISLSREWLRFLKRWRPSYGDAAYDANDDNDYDEDDEGKQ